MTNHRSALNAISVSLLLLSLTIVGRLHGESPINQSPVDESQSTTGNAGAADTPEADVEASPVTAGVLPIDADTPASGGGGGATESLPASDVEFFERHVRPLLIRHCYECHTANDVNGGLLLDSRSGWMAGGDSGTAIVPGQPDQSLLIEAVRYTNRDLQMPPKNKLGSAEIAILETWVARGAPDPRTLAKANAATGPTGMSIEDGRVFWSLQPVGDPPVPVVAASDRVKTPIDAFVLSKLESVGLVAAAQADKRTLLRRLTFDLTGLPPTLAEIRAFLADDSDAAVKTVVERLLESPHYGVRWGRHWLDVARYADSNGLDENLAFGNAWRYRDYVVNAFTLDKPFDRFLIEQLAGDLLPDASQESKIATGFLVLGAKVLAEPDREKLTMDTIDEQLDTTGKAFLGMTFGCVRCHDHKFDPIKQSDYYALAAILKSTKTFGDTNTGAIKHWHEYSFATEAELAELKTIDAEIARKNSAAATFKNQHIAKLRDAARASATEYLMACVLFDPEMPLTEVTRIARPFDLHPRILHHCRLHLEYHRSDPFFAAWHELTAAADSEATATQSVEAHYRPLFDKAESAFAELRKVDPKATTLPDDNLQAVRLALHDTSGFLAVPPKPEFAFVEDTLAEYNRLMEEARVFESHARDEPSALGVADGTILTSLPIHVRGSHRNLGAPVDREFPEVMRTSTVRPVLPTGQSGRLELAQWMANSRHPLTARVYVNRIWSWHFGEGLVKSTENFGALGDRPSHPELLDWLARRFIEAGWSTQALHRLIVLSNTYQMAAAHADERLPASTDSSHVTPAHVTPADIDPADIDPENRLLWKFRMQRMDAEQIRDSILAISGRLDMSLGGKTVPLRNRQFVFNHTSVDHTKYDSLRRAIYLPVIRNNVYTLFEQFDFPDPTMPTGHRNATVVAPQALLLMNSDLVMDSATAMAKQLLESPADPADRIRAAYELTLARLPADVEIDRALSFIDDFNSTVIAGAADVDPDATLTAWSLFCQSLFASNEFIYLR